MFTYLFGRLTSSPKHEGSWKFDHQPVDVRAARRRKYKAAGKLARLVIAARDASVTISLSEAERINRRTPDGLNGDYYVYRCVEAHFLPALNGWRKERVRYFSRVETYYNLASHVRGPLRRLGNTDPKFVARHQACYHACMVVHNVHLAIFALVTGHDNRISTEAALEELAQVYYHAKLSKGEAANLETIREEASKKFAF